MTGLFDDAPVISSYSRAQAIEDGDLVDVSEVAREAGITFPTAMTRAAFEDLVTWDSENGAHQDESGRLWDVVWMLRCTAARSSGKDRIEVPLLRVPNRSGEIAAVETKFFAVCGPGDTPEPVVTIMLEGED